MQVCLAPAARLFCLCGLLLTAVCPITSSQNAKGPNESQVLRLTIRTDKNRYPQGSTIPVHVKVTNISQRDIIVGRDMWSNASPSRVQLAITPADGHDMEGIAWVADGFPPGYSGKAVLQWCISLAPGYSYESDTSLDAFVPKKDLTPGLYRVRAVFESSGIHADTYFNPLLDNKKELEQLEDQDWKGVIGSNELSVQITVDTRK